MAGSDLSNNYTASVASRDGAILEFTNEGQTVDLKASGAQVTKALENIKDAQANHLMYWSYTNMRGQSGIWSPHSAYHYLATHDRYAPDSRTARIDLNFTDQNGKNKQILLNASRDVRSDITNTDVSLKRPAKKPAFLTLPAACITLLIQA